MLEEIILFPKRQQEVELDNWGWVSVFWIETVPSGRNHVVKSSNLYNNMRHEKNGSVTCQSDEEKENCDWTKTQPHHLRYERPVHIIVLQRALWENPKT